MAAVLVAAGVALLSVQNSKNSTIPASRELELVARIDMRDAMRMVHDEHDRVLSQVDRQRTEAEQKAGEATYAFEQARLAAAQEAARKLAEQRAAEQRAAEQRAAEQRAAEKRLADASLAKTIPRPKPEPVAASAPLDIVPVTGGESGPLVSKPRGPIETVVAKVGDVTTDIKNTAVATVMGITGWFTSAGDKLLGREKTPPPAPTSRLSSSAD